MSRILFGALVRVNHRLERATHDDSETVVRRVWEAETIPETEAMIIGIRYLCNGVLMGTEIHGRMDALGGCDEEVTPPHLKVTERFKAYLVVRNMNTNPFYVKDFEPYRRS